MGMLLSTGYVPNICPIVLSFDKCLYVRPQKIRCLFERIFCSLMLLDNVIIYVHTR